MIPHIAFIGRAGAGKTTAAELLVKRFGYARLSFAAPLKVACGTSTDRTLLQEVGVGVRALHEDFWVNLLVDELYNGTYFVDRAGVVVDDCRFPNEAHRLKVEGFKIVAVVADHGRRVERLRANGKLQDESQLEHESETSLDDFAPDYTILNHGTADELLEQLTDILNREQR
jgi:dephospho-CoA kinase